MLEITYQSNLKASLALLEQWLNAYASTDAITWLKEKNSQALLQKDSSLHFMTFSAVPHYFSKDIPKLSKDDLKSADSIRKNWYPINWSLTQIARTYFILELANQQLEQYSDIINTMAGAADIHELITLYQALPLFPYPSKFNLFATNGIRSNMLSVFEAIALNNPYPADFFNETAWNQVILKTFFVDSNIQQVIGVKRRANPTLAKMLINTARERAAAKRTIRPELWAILGFSANADSLVELESLLANDNAVLKEGAFLACSFSNLPKAETLLTQHAILKDQLKTEKNNLDSFSNNLI